MLGDTYEAFSFMNTSGTGFPLFSSQWSRDMEIPKPVNNYSVIT